MAYHRAYYSIIQYCPDRGRAEAANVGVVVMCPELSFVDAKISTNNARIRRFFGSASFDSLRLQLIKNAFEDRIKERFDWSDGLADLERFIATRANDLQLTAPRSLKTDNPRADLDGLFRDFVDANRSPKRTPQPASFRHLREALRAPGMQNRITFNEKILIPVLGKELTIPYTYHNGVTNLIKPQLFRGGADAVSRIASELAVEGDLLQRHRVGRERKLIVVASFADDARQMEAQVDHLFAEYQVRVVDETAVDALVQEIDINAHII
jgi:hypothetical protein